MSATLPETEAAHPGFTSIETLPPEQILTLLLDHQLQAVTSIRPALPALAAAATEAAGRIAAGGILAYAGAGTSGRIAVQDGAELPPTFGHPRDRLLLLMAGGTAALTQAAEGAEDIATGADAAPLGPGDVLVAVAASGATPYTLACLQAARANGALTIALANSPGPLLQAAHHPILLATGPEPIAGSTRLGAGTAQKIALNLFSTLLMMRLGRVYKGQMVDMQATNAKLRRRALRMLQTLAGASEPDAAAALEAAAGHVKTAILILDGHTPRSAADALAHARGNLHEARKDGA